MTFAPAPEYQVFPSGPEPLDFYEAVVHATRDTLPLVRELRPDVVVADILTLAPALAAELEGVPLRDAHPPRPSARRAATSRSTRSARACRARAAGRALWRRAQRAGRRAASSAGARELNETRARARPAAARPRPRRHQPRARARRDVPPARVPARWPEHVHVVGPLMWEPPGGDVELPPGDAPLVLVAPSTAQDAEHRLLRAALRGLADAPVRVLATWNRRLPPRPLPVPDERARRRLGLLLAHDAALRRRRLPRRPRHARARARPRLRRRRLPRRRRHERERRAPRLGRRRRARCRGASPRRARCASPSSARSATPSIGRGRASLPRGPRGTTRARRPRGSSSGWRRDGTKLPRSKLRGWDSNPQPHRLTADRSAN